MVQEQKMYSKRLQPRSNQVTGIGTNEETVDFKTFKVLPSISAKYTINDKQNLRFAASQTYTLPQLQEMPFMSFKEGISDDVFGNPYLSPSDIYNADIKWEFFPKGGQKFSVTHIWKVHN